MAIPLELMPWVIPQLLSQVPSPYQGYFLVFFEAGTTTRQVVYADWTQSTSLGSQVILDQTGYPSDGVNPTSIFLQSQGYKISLCPPLPMDPTNPDTASPVRTVDGVENVGQSFFADFANVSTEGQRNAPDGYAVTPTDNFITFLGSATGVLQLQDPVDRGFPLILQVVGTTNMVITPAGSTTINGVNASYTIAHGTSPKWPTVVLYSDGVSDMRIVSGIYVT